MLRKRAVVNMLLQALLSSGEDAARGRDLQRFVVKWKHNAQGQCVIAIVTDDPRLARQRLEPRPNGYRPPRRD
jgi:hypothetical protein